MPTRRTESTHEADQAQPLPPSSAEGKVESPSGDRLQGAPGLPHQPDPDEGMGFGGDQDIDTAGTEADDDSAAVKRGTGLAPSSGRG